MAVRLRHYVGENAGGISQDQADDIIRNNAKISFLPENSLALDGVIAKAASHDTLFGARLVGDWDIGGELDFAPGITTLNLGDLVTQNGVVYEALEAGLDDQTTVDAPDANPTAWRVYKIQTMPYDDTGLTQLINGRTTPAQAKAQAEDAIGESLAEDGSIANYVRDNAGSGGGGGEPFTDEQVRQALVDYSGTAPLSYDVKFAQDTARQVAEPFRTGVFNQNDIQAGNL